MVKCFAYCSLCNTQDQWMLYHSVQNETTAAQSTENPCSRTYQRVVLLSHIWEAKASFKSSRRKGSSASSKHTPCSPCPYSLCANTVTSEYEKEKGEKNPKQPKKSTVYRIVEDKMLHITQWVPPLDYTRLDAALNQIDFAVSKEGMERWWGWRTTKLSIKQQRSHLNVNEKLLLFPPDKWLEEELRALGRISEV